MPERLFYPLYALQHRGQEAAGLTYRKADSMVTYKDLGLVSQVLGHYLHEEHPSHLGIGHVRYSTTGGSLIQNVQPFHILCNKGEVAVAHNGNISNIDEIKSRLTAEGAIFQSTSDTEVLLHLLSHSRQTDFYDALTETLGQLEGAFSMVFLHGDDLIAVRDPKGFRPLYLGQKDGLTVFVSETCALDLLGIDDYREVLPGEMIVVNESGVTSRIFGVSPKKAHCIFEFIYFARPDSEIFGRSVYQMRQKIGQRLAALDPIQADVVIPVPDSGNAAALGYARAKGIPFEMGLTRNHFAGRSFTLPSQAARDFAVRMKLNPVNFLVEGKSVVLVDDSLVRGTTSKRIVKLVREAGAREVHLRLSAPEIKYPCFYGIDIPTREELISNRLDPDQLAHELGADSVLFLPLDDLKPCAEPNGDDYCYACFSGHYPERLTALCERQTVLKDPGNFPSLPKP
ncbi:MAG: amidophosphoribosyltransferase [Spirochaetales bacterium]|nr:amidophosphoribosyltransferase [Spirochaetales bacterium]